ncbi:MAG: hypothetical protein ABI639_14530 [Thermoanaerobaculia bacterium]
MSVTPKERIEAVLSFAYRGIHHVDAKIKFQHNDTQATVNTRKDLATFDYDLLTRLVVAAHDQCVRLSICPSGPGRIQLFLCARTVRKGRMCERHPTMQEIVVIMMGEFFARTGQCSELRIRNLNGTFAPARTYPRAADPKRSKG